MSTSIHMAGLPGMQLPAKAVRENPPVRPARPGRDVLREAREYQALSGKLWYSSLGCSD